MIVSKLDFFVQAPLGDLIEVGSLDVSAITNNLHGMYFSPDGTKLFLTEYGGTDDVFRWDLSTAWDLDSASLWGNTDGLSSQPFGLYFKDDGLKVFIFDIGGSDRVYQAVLSTAWDTDSNSGFTLGNLLSAKNSASFMFSPDGSKFYYDGGGDGIYQVTMSTNWDVTTGGTPVAFDMRNDTESIWKFCFYDNGNKIFFSSGSDLNLLTLSSAYDLSTMSDIVDTTENAKIWGDILVSSDDVYLYAMNMTTKIITQFQLNF